MHKLLQRQLKYHLGLELVETLPEPWRRFVTNIDEAYQQADADRQLLERSLELSSQELLQTNSEMRAVFQAFPDLCFRLDHTGTILDYRGGSAADFYLPPDQLVGTRIQDIPVEAVQRKFEEAIQRVRQTRAATSIEYTLRMRDREDSYEARLVPLLDDQLIVIIRNITERKRAEERLRKTAEDLARSNAELEQFANVASHDLQEPLRTVTSYTQLLAKRYTNQLDAQAKEFMGLIVEGALRMHTLINDLLVYSRIGTQSKPFAPTDIAAVVGHALASLNTAIQESGAVVTCDGLSTVMADATQLAELFQRLLDNAVKFRKPAEPPQVHITAKREGAEWVFAIRDNGIGMDPKYARQIFVIFQRLHTQAEYPGTGIGLAICKKIVERHGGRIWVDSQPDQGATFSFTLPAV